jgi:hypothetical protein
MLGPLECRVAGHALRYELNEDSPLDPRYWVGTQGATAEDREITPEPRTRRKDVGGFAAGNLACDTAARRFYVGNGFHGYFVAMTTEGRELWRAELPGFHEVVSRIEKAAEPTAEFLTSILREDGSLFTKLSASGPFVAAEYRTGDLYFQAIYHRSGRPIGVIGPWNGIIKEPFSEGWRLVYTASMEPDGYFFPDREITLRVVDEHVEPLAEYLLASVTPTRSGAKLEWSMCPGGAADLGEMVPGPWRPALAKTAINTRNRLGPEWIEGLAARMEASGIDDPREALLAVGADVELMEAATAESAGGP